MFLTLGKFLVFLTRFLKRVVPNVVGIVRELQIKRLLSSNLLPHEGDAFISKRKDSLRIIVGEMRLTVNGKIAPELLRAGANVLVAGGAIFKADDKKAVVAELIGNAPHKRGRDIQAADNNSGPGGAASSFEDDACPDA